MAGLVGTSCEFKRFHHAYECSHMEMIASLVHMNIPTWITNEPCFISYKTIQLLTHSEWIRHDVELSGICMVKRYGHKV